MGVENTEGLLLIYSTFPNYEVAYEISGTLVREGLIGCANLFPNVTSIYPWDGEIKTSIEYAAILKTSSKFEKRVILRIEEMHPYTTPAVFSVPVSKCSPAFLNWVKSLLQNP